MASKDEEAGEDGAENAEGAATEGSKKGLGKILGLLKNKKLLIIAAPVLLLLLGGGGAGAYFFLLKPSGADNKPQAAEAVLTPPQVAFADVPDILVNIQSNDGTPAYLK